MYSTVYCVPSHIIIVHASAPHLTTYNRPLRAQSASQAIARPVYLWCAVPMYNDIITFMGRHLQPDCNVLTASMFSIELCTYMLCIITMNQRRAMQTYQQLT